MKLCWIPILAMLSLGAGCGRFPQDSEGTLDQVSHGELRVGVAHGGQLPALPPFIDRLSERTGSRVALSPGSAEPLLMELEEGRIDLVVGLFDRRSPWSKRVTFSQPIARVEKGGVEQELKAAVRNGEHAWAMEVDRAIAAMTGAKR